MGASHEDVCTFMSFLDVMLVVVAGLTATRPTYFWHVNRRDTVKTITVAMFAEISDLMWW